MSSPVSPNPSLNASVSVGKKPIECSCLKHGQQYAKLYPQLSTAYAEANSSNSILGKNSQQSTYAANFINVYTLASLEFEKTVIQLENIFRENCSNCTKDLFNAGNHFFESDQFSTALLYFVVAYELVMKPSLENSIFPVLKEKLDLCLGKISPKEKYIDLYFFSQRLGLKSVQEKIKELVTIDQESLKFIFSVEQNEINTHEILDRWALTLLEKKGEDFFSESNNDLIMYQQLVVETGFVQCAKKLLETDSRESTQFVQRATQRLLDPFIKFKQVCYIEIIQWLITKKNVSPNLCIAEGNYLVHHAFESGHVRFINFLIEKECQLNVLDNSGNTVLHYLSRGPQEHLSLLKKILINNSSLVNTSNVFGKFPHEIAKKNKLARTYTILFELFKAQGGDSNSTQIINCPLPPKDFIGRVEELERLHQACKSSARVSISGLGGLGKSTLALKYADKYKTDYQFIHFIPADNPELIIEGLLKLADDLHIIENVAPTKRLDLLKILLDRYEKKYLIIFDGVDQVEASYELDKYIPLRGSCLLITTRRPEDSKIRNFQLIELNVLSPEDAKSYLLSVTKSTENEAAAKLAEEFGYLPLALAHAARFIRTQNISIQQYIDSFKKNELEIFKNKYLNMIKTERTILTTWSISMQAIENIHKCSLAKKLLAFLAFLGQAPIPFAIVESWFQIIESSESNFFISRFYRNFLKMWNKKIPTYNLLEIQNTLRYLQDYSMVNKSETGFYHVHPLVQKVTSYQMNDEEQTRAFKQAVYALSNLVEPLNSSKNTLEFYLSHFQSLFERQDLLKGLDFKTRLNIISKMSLILIYLQKHQEVQSIYEYTLEIIEEWYKKEPNIAENYLFVASTLYSLTRYKESLSHLKKALEINNKAFLINRYLNAEIYSAIGLTLNHLKKPQKALIYYQKELEILRKSLGDNHSLTADSYYGIGLTLSQLENFEEALKNFQLALNIKKEILGENPLIIAEIYQQLGLTFYTLKRFNDALKNHQNAIQIRIQTLGDNHPQTADSYYEIGLTLSELENFEEALKNFQQALKIEKETLGENYLKTAESYQQVGLTLYNLKKFNDALKNHQDALQIRIQTLGDKHLQTADSYYLIGLTFSQLEEFEEALKNFQQALKIEKEILGENNFRVAESYHEVGNTFYNLKKFNDALKNYQTALQIRIQTLKNFKQALNIEKKILGENNLRTAESYHEVGITFYNLKKFNEALKNHQNALQIRIGILGDNHLQTADSYYEIGSTLTQLENFEEALKSHQKSLEIRKNF